MYTSICIATSSYYSISSALTQGHPMTQFFHARIRTSWSLRCNVALGHKFTQSSDCWGHFNSPYCIFIFLDLMWYYGFCRWIFLLQVIGTFVDQGATYKWPIATTSDTCATPKKSGSNHFRSHRCLEAYSSTQVPLTQSRCPSLASFDSSKIYSA